MADDTAPPARDTRQQKARSTIRFMNASETRLDQARGERAEAIVARHVLALFERIPALCGFSVRHDLGGIDVSVCTWPGHDAEDDLYEELMQALNDIAEERPDAVQLLRGRTFARAIH